MFLGINVCVGAFLYRFFWSLWVCAHAVPEGMRKKVRGRIRGEEEMVGVEKE